MLEIYLLFDQFDQLRDLAPTGTVDKITSV